ncbi:helix-turn-helix transcriptional regulator [Maritalea sp.]|uniref:helix-turn-helix transcriptional regulator n=1 Tax=Maritalea sp. TaxID=2003361 RepID=UPI003EF66046
MDFHSAAKFIEGEFKLTDRHDALVVFQQKVQEWGVDHLAYGIIRLGARSDGRSFDFITTYSDEWQSRYLSRKYHELDPVIKEATQRHTPFDWDTKRYKTPELVKFFSDSTEHGLGNQGITVPIHGPEGECCAMSANVSMSNRQWRDKRNKILPHLVLFAHQFHAKVLKLCQPSPGEVQLSNREIEVLQWAAEGKSVWETAQILGISDHSVKTYLQNCQRKLRGVNKLHAVVTAMRLGAI